MYDLERAGGVAYPETEKYDYNKWYTTMGMTDGSAYKAIRFDVRQDNLLLHWPKFLFRIERTGYQKGRQ